MTTQSISSARNLQNIMTTSCLEKEQQCVLHWFQGWSPLQKKDFLNDMVEKAVPHHVDSLFDAMETMSVVDKPPSIFQCQLKLFTQWFAGWTDAERNQFIHNLQLIDPQFVSEFNLQVDMASGRVN